MSLTEFVVGGGHRTAAGHRMIMHMRASLRIKLLMATLAMVPAYTYGMDIYECGQTDGFTQFMSNGFTCYADASTMAFIDTVATHNGQTSNPPITFRQGLHNATANARYWLQNMTDGDAPFELAISKVPFRIQAEGSVQAVDSTQLGLGLGLVDSPSSLPTYSLYSLYAVM